MKKRIILAILTGALLGIFCIIGVSYRFGFSGNELFIFATWFNRVVMGIFIGLAGPLIFIKNRFNFLIRGAVFGFIISFSFYIATEFRDTIGFIAGILYGVIIDYIATKFNKVK
ncbi:hypothetical protein C0580_04865 [Candidatus Parcubacteria bacterium]|nr:MAG: hypothetical protein C0580_04865 [Candidatus Parcubacteria bacterium]